MAESGREHHHDGGSAAGWMREALQECLVVLTLENRTDLQVVGVVDLVIMVEFE